MDRWWQHFRDWRLVLRYGVSGIAGAITNLAVYAGLAERLNIWYIAAAVIAFAAALVVSFLLQKLWTFRDNRRERLAFQGGWYLGIALAMLGLNLGILSSLVELARLPALPAQAITLFSLGIISFLINKMVTFRI